MRTKEMEVPWAREFHSPIPEDDCNKLDQPSAMPQLHGASASDRAMAPALDYGM
jgi:hypothetical protein